MAAPGRTWGKALIAYLNTKYPSLSHTFIEREIRGLRQRGLDIKTFSIRKPDTCDTLSDHHREARDQTTYLLDGMACLLHSVLWCVVTRPARFIMTMVRSQRLALPGVKGRLLYLAYFVEATRLAQQMVRHGLDHVHVHMANNGATVAMFAVDLIKGGSYSMTIHGSAEFFDVQHHRLGPKAERARFVRCISSFCRAQVMAWSSPTNWNSYHVVHCGVDPKAFSQLERLPDDRLRLLTVGRIVPIKGYPLLLQACSQLSRQGIEWSLDMVGDGPMLSDLKQLARQLGVQDNVAFHGAVGQDEIQQCYERCNVMVVSSFMEGVPVVLMEAMAKGLAVVSTDVGGIRELVLTERTGWLVRPGSIEALEQGLCKAARHLGGLSAMGRLGRQRVIDGFSVHCMCDQMYHIFQELGYCKVTTVPAIKSGPTSTCSTSSAMGSVQNEV